MGGALIRCTLGITKGPLIKSLKAIFACALIYEVYHFTRACRNGRNEIRLRRGRKSDVHVSSFEGRTGRVGGTLRLDEVLSCAADRDRGSCCPANVSACSFCPLVRIAGIVRYKRECFCLWRANDICTGICDLKVRGVDWMLRNVAWISSVCD